MSIIYILIFEIIILFVASKIKRFRFLYLIVSLLGTSVPLVFIVLGLFEKNPYTIVLAGICLFGVPVITTQNSKLT